MSMLLGVCFKHMLKLAVQGQCLSIMHQMLSTGLFCLALHTNTCPCSLANLANTADITLTHVKMHVQHDVGHYSGMVCILLAC